jgi:hypothetical protein
MKKFIGILLLFVMSLFIGKAQNKIMYVDSLKSVTVSVSSDTEKQTKAVNDLQLQFAKAVDSQTTVNGQLKEAFVSLDSGLTSYRQVIEERNKSDTKLITDVFSYTPERVKQVMRKERWLNFILSLFGIVYVVSVLSQMSGKYSVRDMVAIRLAFYLLYGIAMFIILYSLLTLLFNGDYYVIKELMNLYT